MNGIDETKNPMENTTANETPTVAETPTANEPFTVPDLLTATGTSANTGASAEIDASAEVEALAESELSAESESSAEADTEIESEATDYQKPAKKTYPLAAVLIPVVAVVILVVAFIFAMGKNNNKQTPELSTNNTPESPVQTEQTQPPEISTSPSQTEDDSNTYSAGLDQNGFWKGIKALDYIETLEYREISIPNDIHNISDDALQAEIDGILSNYTSNAQVTDRDVVDGDTVNIDFVGSIDGVEFDGGSTNGMGTDVTIGVTEYIDDFLEQLIGHFPGETIDVKVTFPDDYMEETLQGKDALFVTTINYINGETVAAELTDAFVAGNLTATYGWKNVAEMKEKMRSEMRRQSLEQFVMEYLTTEVAVKSVPDSLIDYQEGVMMHYYQEYASYYGVDINELLANEGLSSIDELTERYSDFNTQNATYYLVIQAIAEDTGISVSDEDISNYFLDVYGSSDYSAQEAEYGLPYLKQSVLRLKVTDYIVENAILL